MSKPVVINDIDQARFPFLRGMLVKSLQQAGLRFEDAYRVATDVRDDLGNDEAITTSELRTRIEEILAEEFPGQVLTRYKKEDVSPENIRIISDNGNGDAFSRAVFVRRLESCAIPTNRCHAITRKIHSELIREKITEITTQELATRTYRTVHSAEGQKIADYYLIWRDFQRSGYPMLLLIGGMPGCGKSTIATEIANRLGIVRTQSTDMLREVMRILIPKNLSPALHTSSFKAGKFIKRQESERKQDARLFYGFQLQTEMVEVACEAVIQRAINENVSMILEGVHIRPSLLHKIKLKAGVVVPINLAVLNKKRLVKFIKGRSVTNKQRRAKRYLSNLDNIWLLQDKLLSEADNADIEIIDNININDTASEIISVIIQTIAATYKDKIVGLRTTYS